MNGCKHVLLVVVVVLSLLNVISATDIGYFWHISDTHVQSDYIVGSNPEEGCFSGTGNAGLFGDYSCRPPYYVELSAMMEMATMSPNECPFANPLFVLWTGDSVALKDGKYTKEGIIFNLKNLTGAFEKVYSVFKGKVPIYPVIGNHDTYPQHQLPPTDFWVYSTLADLWEPFLPKDAVASFKQGGYYTVKVTSGLRLIVLNTVLYYVANKMVNTTEKDPGGQIAWLERTLSQAKNAHESVYIAGHIPIHGPGGPGDDFRGNYIQPFVDAMKKYQSIIKGSFWGHYHTDTFHLLGDDPLNSHVALLAGSISPEGNRNPSFRRFIVDTSNDYIIQSWNTYSLEIPAVNKAGKMRWRFLYSSLDYGLVNITPITVESFVNRIEKDTELFNFMWNNRLGGGPIRSCDDSCRKTFVCFALHPLPDAYQKCIDGLS